MNTIVLQVNCGIVLTNYLTHFLCKKEMFKRITYSTHIPHMLLILSLQIKQISEYTSQAKKIHNRYNQHNQSQKNNIERIVKTLTYFIDKLITNHHLHLRTTFLSIFIVSIYYLIVSTDKCSLFGHL